MAIISAITGWVTTAFLTAGWTLAAATTAAYITIGAGLVGLSALTGTFNQRQPSIKTPQAQAVLNQSVGSRIRGYGRALLGGTRAFWDSKDGTLFQIIMAHHGEIDAWEYFMVGDRAVTPDANGDVTNRAFVWVDDSDNDQYAVRIREHLGTDDQAADSMMQSVWPQWTTEHQLRGIAYFAVRFRSPPPEKTQIIFPEGSNTPVRGLGRLSKVYDPRDPDQDPEDNSTWQWSELAGPVILDYLTHPDGMRLSKDDCDLDSFAAFTDLCDEDVPLAEGGTEKRYRLWGIYQLTDEPDVVLQRMRRACDAELYHTPEGKIGIRGGEWTPPTVTLRAYSVDGTARPDILHHSLEQGNNRFNAFNELKITYTSPEHGYQTMEATAWTDPDDQAERGPIPTDLDLDFVPSPTQARRLAKIHIAKSNPAWKGRVRCSLAALDAWGERTVRLVIPELEIDDAFYISKIELAPDLTAVEMEVVTINEAAYTWSTAEEGENPALPQETAPDLEFPVPQGAVLAEDETTPYLIIGTVNAPGRDDLELEAQIRLGAGGLWFDMQTKSQTEAVYQATEDGDYQARFRWKGPQSTVGAWSSPLAEITLPVPPPEP